MEIQVRARGLPGAAAIRRLAAGRIGDALAEFRDAIDEVAVQLSDINGPERGGIDKLCRAVVRFRDCSAIVVEELGRDVAGVIERIAQRLREHVQRRPRARLALSA